MDFAIILAVTIVGCFALRNPLKALPVAFYAAAIAIDVVYVYGVFFGLPRAIWSPLFVLIQKCELSLALFVVVMFIGCLNRDGRAYHWLKPVRSELSIVAWFLSLGHMAVYLGSYLPRLLGNASINSNVAVAFGVAVALFVLLALLGVTSLGIVKRAMSSRRWTRIQRFAYLFFALIFTYIIFCAKIQFNVYERLYIFSIKVIGNYLICRRYKFAWRYNYSTFIVCVICCKCIKCFCSISTHRIYFCSIITKCLKS